MEGKFVIPIEKFRVIALLWYYSHQVSSVNE